MSDASSSNAEPAKVRVGPAVPWNPWLAVATVVFLYIFTQFVGVQIVAIYPFTKHWSDAITTTWLTNNIFAQFFYVLIAEVLTLLLLWLFLHLFKVTFRIIGLVKPKLVDIAYALTGLAIYFPAYIVIATVLSRYIGLNTNQQQQIGFNTATGGLQWGLVFFSLVILPPIVEEIVFRGLLYTSLRKKMTVVWAAVATSALFAAPHLLEGGSSGLLWIAAVDTFVLSLVLCWLRQKTGRLYAGMGLHALKNFIAFASLFIFHVH